MGYLNNIDVISKEKECRSQALTHHSVAELSPGYSTILNYYPQKHYFFNFQKTEILNLFWGHFFPVFISIISMKRLKLKLGFYFKVKSCLSFEDEMRLVAACAGLRWCLACLLSKLYMFLTLCIVVLWGSQSSHSAVRTRWLLLFGCQDTETLAYSYS